MAWIPSLLVGLTIAGSAMAQEPDAGSTASVTVTLRGRAIDEAGLPIAGACLARAKPEELTTQWALDHPSSTSKADGRFELSWTMPQDRAQWLLETQELLLTAPGRAAGVPHGYWSPVAAATDAQVSDLGDIVLPAAVVIRGNVRREDGRPLEGVRVAATDVLSSSLLATFFTAGIGFESRAKTDEKGMFVLLGVLPPGAQLTFTAPGWRSVRLPFVAPTDPLVVDMSESGFVEGIVYDRDGKPAQAHVSVRYEVGEALHDGQLSGEDGRFHLSLDWPHRYMVTAWVREGSVYTQSARSDVLTGPQVGVAVRAMVRKPDGPTVSVRVLDEETAGPVEHIQAAALWSDPVFLRAMSGLVVQQFSAKAVRAEQPGEVRLPGPREREPSTGVVVVKAPGYVAATLKDVVWDEDDPPELEVRLVRESVLSGVVIDEATGKPIEGASVVVAEKLRDQPWMRGAGQVEQGGNVTDKDGRFRIGGLGAGKHTIRAMLPFRPDSETLAVELAAREERHDLEFAIPTGATLSGKIVGVESTAGWRVRLVKTEKSPQFSSGYDPYGRESRIARVASDGSFEVKGLPADHYTVEALIPERHLQGGHLAIPIEAVQVREKELQRDFDVSADLPGTIQGRLRLEGAPFSPERLMVTATKKVEPGRMSYHSWEDQAVRGLIAADGSFRLDVVPGVHKLRVVDLQTKIVLLDDLDHVTVAAGKVAKRDLTLELTKVRVFLQPAQQGDLVLASRLEVVVRHEPEGDEVPLTISGLTWDSGAGVSLSDGRREVTLFLPCISTKLRVHTNLHELLRQPDEPWSEVEPLAEHEFTPRPGESNRVEVSVKKSDR